MSIQFAIGLILTIPCVILHALGILLLFYWLEHKLPVIFEQFVLFKNFLVVCLLLLVMLGLHIAEIVIWASYYSWEGLFDNFQMSLYYSFSTYTTVGYGDVVLPPSSQLIGSVETCVGLLLFGFSTAFFWSVVSYFLAERHRRYTIPGKR